MIVFHKSCGSVVEKTFVIFIEKNYGIFMLKQAHYASAPLKSRGVLLCVRMSWRKSILNRFELWTITHAMSSLLRLFVSSVTHSYNGGNSVQVLHIAEG